MHPLPDCEDVRLGLINADFPEGPLPADVMRAVIDAPAYWAFCWGSGLGLARWLRAHPDWVRDRSIVDLGAGSGVVAIAAKRFGARRVIACDNDPAAIAAIRANATLNGVDVEVVDTLEQVASGHDLLVMADVLYDRSNLPLLERARHLADRILVADSRLRTLPDASFVPIAEIEARTFPNLGEFDEFATVRVFLHDRRRQQQQHVAP